MGIGSAGRYTEMAKKLINHDFVKQLVEDGKSVAQISRKLDVSPGLMYRWFDHEGIDLLNQVRANGKKTQLNGRKIGLIMLVCVK